MKQIKQFIGLGLIGLTFIGLIFLEIFNPYMNNFMLLITYWKEIILGLMVCLLGCYLAFN